MKRPDNITPENWKEIESLIYSNQKIAAIKAYRKATNSGLKESKDFVDALEVEMRKENPQNFSAKKAGCGTAILLFSLLPYLYYLWH